MWGMKVRREEEIAWLVECWLATVEVQGKIIAFGKKMIGRCAGRMSLIVNHYEIIVTLKYNRHFKRDNGQSIADNGHFKSKSGCEALNGKYNRHFM